MAVPKHVREIKEFIPGTDFKTYIERFDIYLSLSEIADAVKQKQLFLHVIGQETYELLKKFGRLSKKTPATMTLNECKKVLLDHLSPTRNEYLDCFYFGLRNQKEGETVEEFAAELQILAEKCNYGDFLDRALREKFLIGLLDRESARKILSEEGDLTFERVVKLAKIQQEAGKTLSAVETRSENIKAVDVQQRRRSDFQQGREKFNGYELGKKKTQQAQYKNPQVKNSYTSPNHSSTNQFNSNFRKNNYGNKNEQQCYKCQGFGHISRDCATGRPRNLKLISESFMSDEWCENVEEEVNQVKWSNQVTSMPEYRYL